MTDVWNRPPTGDQLPGQARDTGPTRLHFGTLTHQEIRWEVAEHMLIAWHQRDPKRFGDALRDSLMADLGGGA